MDRREYHRKWKSEHPNYHRDYMRKYREINGDKERDARKANYHSLSADGRKRRNQQYDKVRRRARIREWQKRHRIAKINYRIAGNLRARLMCGLRGKCKSASTVKLLGCSIEDFKLYIESKWDSGMNWINYGQRWHLDHIIPCAIFDLSKPEHQRRCFHFSNIQPMWAADNQSKGSKVISDQFNLL